MKIFVVKNQQLLGSLIEENGNIKFIYHNKIPSSSYLNGLNKKENISKTLFSIFENMLPEFEQVKLIKSQNNLTSEIEVLLYLNNIHGSFEFYTEEGFKNKEFKIQSIFQYNEVKDEILDNEYIFPNILEYDLNIDYSILYPEGLTNSKVIGLSGYQYKFSVIKDDVQNKISYDETKSSNYFMKPYSKYYSTYAGNDKDRSYIPFLLINEHIFMTLARDLGFSVPYNAIIKDGNDYHYIIKRFDRYEKLKIDHQEILTLMNKKSDQKYTITMRDIFETVKEYISQNEIEELYRFIIFSIVIGHGDLHGKNLSLIYLSNKFDEKNMQLSPYYDISTTKIYKDTKVNDIGLKIGSKKRNIKRIDLLSFAKLIKISDDRAKELIKEVSYKFKDTFERYIEKLPSSIKSLPYHVNKYGGIKPFEEVLKEYYKNRVDSLYKKEFIEKLEAKNTQEDDIWD